MVAQPEAVVNGIAPEHRSFGGADASCTQILNVASVVGTAAAVIEYILI